MGIPLLPLLGGRCLYTCIETASRSRIYERPGTKHDQYENKTRRIIYGNIVCGDYYTWWRHQMETFSGYWPFMWGIHRSPMNSPHKGQWRGALMFSLICAWINCWLSNREAGDLRRHRSHYDVIVMKWTSVAHESINLRMKYFDMIIVLLIYIFCVSLIIQFSEILT